MGMAFPKPIHQDAAMRGRFFGMVSPWGVACVCCGVMEVAALPDEVTNDPARKMEETFGHVPGEPMWQCTADLNGDGRAEVLLCYDRYFDPAQGWNWTIFEALPSGGYRERGCLVSFLPEAAALVKRKEDTVPHLVIYDQDGDTDSGDLSEYVLTADGLRKQTLSEHFHPAGADQQTYEAWFAKDRRLAVTNVGKPRPTPPDPVVTSSLEAGELVSDARRERKLPIGDAMTGQTAGRRVKLPFPIADFGAKDDIVWQVDIRRMTEADLLGGAWVHPASGKVCFFDQLWMERERQEGHAAPVPATGATTTEQDAGRLIPTLYRENMKPPYDAEPGVMTVRPMKLPVTVEGFHAKDEIVWRVEVHAPEGKRPATVVAWVSRTSSQVVVVSAPWLDVDPPEKLVGQPPRPRVMAKPQGD